MPAARLPAPPKQGTGPEIPCGNVQDSDAPAHTPDAPRRLNTDVKIIGGIIGPRIRSLPVTQQVMRRNVYVSRLRCESPPDICWYASVSGSASLLMIGQIDPQSSVIDPIVLIQTD